MALVSISEASKLVGKNRTTLYKYIDSGRLSSTLDKNGNKVIDFIELLRLFPDAKLPQDKQQVVVENQQSATLYQHEIDKLKQEIVHLNKVVSLKDELLIAQKHTIQALEYKKDTVEFIEKDVEKSTTIVDKKRRWKFW